MAAGDLITTAWQLELNGILMGPSTNYTVRNLDMWSAPELRQGETARAQAHGMYQGTDWLSSRLVAAQLYVAAQTTDAAEIGLRQVLAGAWQPPSDGGTVPLVWQEDDGVKYRLNGKPRLASSAVSPRMPTECRFVATDPRIYANTLSTASTGLASSGGGFAVPALVPWSGGSGGTGSTISCPNTGTFSTPWVATFTGPLVGPALTHSSGNVLNFGGASLAAGETLVVDSAAKTVLLNGTASRYLWLTVTQWFDLIPGANAITLTGASGSGTVSIAWRSAWI